MAQDVSRRRMMQAAGALALAPGGTTVTAAPGEKSWPIVEGPDTPKLCLGIGDGGQGADGNDDAGMRRVKQLAVDYVLGGGGRLPWTEADLRARIDQADAGRQGAHRQGPGRPDSQYDQTPQ